MAGIALIAPSSVPAEDSGRIYVYAQRLTAARSWLAISCEGAVMGKLKQGKLFALSLPPGRHTLSAETGIPAFVVVRSGEESFVRLDWHDEVGRAAIPILSVVPTEQARKEMRFLSYIDAGKAISRAVSKTDPRESPPLRLKSREGS